MNEKLNPRFVSRDWSAGRTTKLAGAVLMTVLLAGCLHNKSNEPGVVLSTTGLTTMEMTDCKGFSGSSQPLPEQVAPGTPPPGWEPRDSTKTRSVRMEGWECNRFHLGYFERGPIRFVWNSHTNADIPANCQGPDPSFGFTHRQILNVVMVNDSEIASFLQKQYAMPAIYADIQTEEQPSGSNTQRTWKWAAEGQGLSHLTFVDEGLYRSDLFGDYFWWIRGEGMAQLAFSYEVSSSGMMIHEGRPVYGVLQPPMLAPPPDGEFVGTASYYTHMTGEGKFAFFSDRLCEHPI